MKKLIVGVLSLAGTFSYAQENEKNIDEVNIQGKLISLPYAKTNGNIVLISKQEIQNSPSKSIEDLLSQFTGMDIRKRGANGVQTDISMRGSSFEQVLILINGVRMNDSQTGHNSMNIPIDLSNVERIEIMKGPSARTYGVNAYAGVINIITKSTNQENVTISASGGDFKTYSLGLSGNFGTEKFTNLFQANTSSSEGYRYNTDYKINNIWYQNQYNIHNGSLKFQAGFTEKKFGANGFYASPLAKDQYEETQASVVSLGYQQNFNRFSLKANAYWRRGQDMYLYIRNKPEAYRNMHIGNNIGGEISASYQSHLGITGVGTEVRKELLVSNNLGERERLVSQAFFEHHFSFFNKKLNIVPGISWANYSNAGNYFYPGIDVGYAINDQHKIYGNIAKVNRVPTYTDLYYVSRTEQGNPFLQPENAISSEVGYQFKNKNTLAKASFFNRNTDNAIDWIKVNATDKWTAQNIGNINTNGFEVEVGQQFNHFFKSYSLGYTFIDNQFKGSGTTLSKYALENLKHQLVGKLENKWKGFTNQFIYKYMERVNLGSYHLLDEKLSYDYKNLNLYILVNNVTNTQYSETFLVPMPGRWFHVGFSYKIGL